MLYEGRHKKPWTAVVAAPSSKRIFKATLQARHYPRLELEVLDHQGKLLKKVTVRLVKVFAI